MALDIQNTFNALAAKLATITNPLPGRIYANPAEAVSLADFPAIVLALAPNQQATWSEESLGYGRCDYTIAIWVFVGSRQTGIEELYSRVIPWPKAIADVLLADLTLGNQVAFVGSPNPSTKLFDWSPQFKQWGDGQYFILEVLLPVVERGVQTMG